MTFTEQLRKMNACSEAIEWVNGRSLRKCWQVADRSEWMLWLINELDVCERERHELACDFAERVLRYVPKGEDRPRIAIETKRKWLIGEATNGELFAAGRGAWDAAWAAWDAAWAAGDAAGAARDAAVAARAASQDAGAARAIAWAAGAARDAAWAAWAARHAGGNAAESKAQCRLIRKRIPVERIEEAINAD